MTPNCFHSARPQPTAVGALPECRMDLAAGPEARDAATGAYSNTENVDCAHCKCDLFLSAVVSPAAPDVAACPEHAEVLVREHGAAADSLTLLYRYTPEVGPGGVGVGLWVEVGGPVHC